MAKAAEKPQETPQKERGQFPLSLLDPPEGKRSDTQKVEKAITGSTKKKDSPIRRGIFSIAREAANEALTEKKQEVIGGIRDKIFNAGIVGSILRKTWEKTHGSEDDKTADMAQRTFGAVQQIAQSSVEATVTLTKIERIVTNISENVTNIAGALKAEARTLQETLAEMKAAQEEASSEAATAPTLLHQQQHTEPTQSGKSWFEKLGDFLGITALASTFKGLMGILQPLAAVLGPAALVIGAAYAGFKLGEWINKTFGISDKLVDGIDWLVNFFGGETKKDTPGQTPAEMVKAGEANTLGEAGKKNMLKARRQYGAMKGGEELLHPAQADIRKSEQGLAAPTTKPTPSATQPTAMVGERAGGVTGKPTVDGSQIEHFDYDKYAEALGKRESNNQYDIVNPEGYVGKYQLGAGALEDVGLVKPGTAKKGNGALDDPSNWTIPGGLKAFLNDKARQEEAMKRYTMLHMKSLKDRGFIKKDSSASEIGSLLAAAHLAGVEGAIKQATGQADRQDSNKTKTSTYAALGANSQKGVRVPVAATSGEKIEQASTTVAAARERQSPPIVVASANPANDNSSSFSSRSRGSIPSPNADRGSAETATRVATV